MKPPKDYLYEVMANFKLLGEVQTKTVFLIATRDYLNGDIDVKVLSSVASKLYYVFNKPFDIDTKFEHDLANLLQDTAELGYYLGEGKKETRNKGIADKILQNLRDYYSRNQSILRNFSRSMASS